MVVIMLGWLELCWHVLHYASQVVIMLEGLSFSKFVTVLIMVVLLSIFSCFDYSNTDIIVILSLIVVMVVLMPARFSKYKHGCHQVGMVVIS